MKCSNCGHENDADAKFCEKCGSNLNRSSMPASTKILIVVVIVLVAIVGVAAGYIFYGSANHTPTTNNTTNTTINSTNQSNTPVNNTTQTNTGNTNSNVNNYPVSESQALQIVEANAGNHPYIYLGTVTVNGETCYFFQYKEGESYNGMLCGTVTM